MATLPSHHHATRPPGGLVRRYADISDDRLATLLRWLWIALGAIPVLLVLLYVLQNGRNIPYADEWRHMTRLAIQTHDGQLSLADLYEQHDAHRAITGKALTALLTVTTGWNLKLQMILNLGVMALVLVVALLLYHRSSAAVRETLIVVALPFAALVFSLRAGTSWVWAILINRSFVVLLFLLAVLALTRTAHRWRSLAVAALLALWAAFTYFDGLVVWLALWPALLLLGYRRPAYLLAWIAAGAAILLAFFAGYTVDEDEALRGSLDIVLVLRYVLAYLGNPLVAGSTGAAILAALGGLALVAINAAYLRFAAPQRAWPGIWLSVVLFPVLVGLVTALGRAHLNFNALATRYVWVPTLFWIAALALIIQVNAQIGRGSRRAKGLRFANLAAFGAIATAYVFINFWAARLPIPVTPAHEDCLLAYPTTRDASCFDGLSPLPVPAMPELVDALAERDLALFGDVPALNP